MPTIHNRRYSYQHTLDPDDLHEFMEEIREAQYQAWGFSNFGGARRRAEPKEVNARPVYEPSPAAKQRDKVGIEFFDPDRAVHVIMPAAGRLGRDRYLYDGETGRPLDLGPYGTDEFDTAFRFDAKAAHDHFTRISQAFARLA